MHKLENRIQAELAKRFADNQKISITMKTSSDVLHINRLEDDEQNYYHAPDENSFFEIVIISKDKTLFPELLSVFKIGIHSLSAFIQNYDKHRQQLIGSMQELERVYDARIKGHTLEELHLGNDINMYIYQQTKENREKPNLTNICEHFQIALEQAETCIKLSDDWQSYSDYYKSVYNRRPVFEN